MKRVNLVLMATSLVGCIHIPVEDKKSEREKWFDDREIEEDLWNLPDSFEGGKNCEELKSLLVQHEQLKIRKQYQEFRYGISKECPKDHIEIAFGDVVEIKGNKIRGFPGGDFVELENGEKFYIPNDKKIQRLVNINEKVFGIVTSDQELLEIKLIRRKHLKITNKIPFPYSIKNRQDRVKVEQVKNGYIVSILEEEKCESIEFTDSAKISKQERDELLLAAADKIERQIQDMGMACEDIYTHIESGFDARQSQFFVLDRNGRVEKSYTILGGKFEPLQMGGGIHEILQKYYDRDISLKNPYTETCYEVGKAFRRQVFFTPQLYIREPSPESAFVGNLQSDHLFAHRGNFYYVDGKWNEEESWSLLSLEWNGIQFEEKELFTRNSRFMNMKKNKNAVIFDELDEKTGKTTSYTYRLK